MGTAAVGPARVLARTCRAEWTRLWTVKGTWWFTAAATVAMVGLGLIAGNDAAGDVVPPVGEPAWIAPSIAALPTQLALLALALGAVTADYATAGIVPTLQWTPRRTTLFAARVLVVVGTATVLGMLLALASGAAAFSMAPDILVLPFDEGVEVVGTTGIVFAAGAGLAAGLGFVLRSTAGALVSVFLLVLLLPLVLPQFRYDWMVDLASVLPGTGAIFLLTGESIADDMTRTSATTVMVCWALGSLALGWTRLVRDDANR
ncbi:ABC transporter permease [Alloalcanivorax gelatiniphagus]